MKYFEVLKLYRNITDQVTIGGFDEKSFYLDMINWTPDPMVVLVHEPENENHGEVVVRYQTKALEIYLTLHEKTLVFHLPSEYGSEIVVQWINPDEINDDPELYTLGDDVPEQYVKELKSPFWKDKI